MNQYKLENFTKGWIIGDFEPNIIRTKDFEFMVRYYKAGDKEQKHVHKIADEITVIISGVFLMNNKKYVKGDIIHLSPGDATDFQCLEDGATAVLKTPSVIGDKYIL
jgi:mannose-6-phosphate isomerase-like protein (cupin superfamily)